MVAELNERQGLDSHTNTDAEGGIGVEGVFVRLWTRRPVSSRQIDVIERLRALDSGGALADFDVQTWPDKVVYSDYTEHCDVVRTYERIRDWADEHGRAIEPPFERRTVTSLVGRTEEILTLPVLCLLVYEDERLRGVFPTEDGDRTWKITDFLEDYETAGELDAAGAVPAAE